MTGVPVAVDPAQYIAPQSTRIGLVRSLAPHRSEKNPSLLQFSKPLPRNDGVPQTPESRFGSLACASDRLENRVSRTGWYRANGSTQSSAQVRPTPPIRDLVGHSVMEPKRLARIYAHRNKTYGRRSTTKNHFRLGPNANTRTDVSPSLQQVPTSTVIHPRSSIKLLVPNATDQQKNDIKKE